MKRREGLSELVGWECSCTFNLPSTEWPIEGYPAWVVVLDIDGQMIKMASKWGNVEEGAMWLNVGIIKKIVRTRKYEWPASREASPQFCRRSLWIDWALGKLSRRFR